MFTDPKCKVLDYWRWKCSVSKCTHYEQAKILSRLDLAFRILIYSLAAITGAEAYSGIRAPTAPVNREATAIVNPEEASPKSNETSVTCLTILSLMLAVLSSLHSGLAPEVKAETHRSSGSRFSSLEKRIEMYLTETELAGNALTDIIKMYDKIVSESPNTSSCIHKKGKSLAILQMRERRRYIV